MSDAKAKVVQTFRADPGLLEALRTLAAKEGRTLSQFIERTLRARVNSAARRRERAK